MADDADVMSAWAGLGYYARAQIMERYVMRSFLQPLMFCLVAFFTLWIVMDLLDNMQDFQENKIGNWQIALYYLKMMPFIYVTVAPITLLLFTLLQFKRETDRVPPAALVESPA